MLTSRRLVPANNELRHRRRTGNEQNPQPDRALILALRPSIAQPTISALCGLCNEDEPGAEAGRLARQK